MYYFSIGSYAEDTQTSDLAAQWELEHLYTRINIYFALKQKTNANHNPQKDTAH